LNINQLKLKDMTRKELIDKFCEFKGKCTTDDVVALTYAYKSLQLDFIDKACEWLRVELDKEEELHYIHVHGFDAERRKEFLEQFRKAMKGGE
jgi:hypothetical protein